MMEISWMVFNVSLFMITLFSIVVSVLFWLPVAYERSETSPFLGGVTAFSWLFTAQATLKDNPDAWIQSYFFYGLFLVCLFQFLKTVVELLPSEGERNFWEVNRR